MAVQNNTIRTMYNLEKRRSNIIACLDYVERERERERGREQYNCIMCECSKLAQKEYKSRQDCVGEGDQLGTVQATEI